MASGGEAGGMRVLLLVRLLQAASSCRGNDIHMNFWESGASKVTNRFLLV